MVMAIIIVSYIIFGLLFWSICMNAQYEKVIVVKIIQIYIKNIQKNGFNSRKDLTIGSKNEWTILSL